MAPTAACPCSGKTLPRLLRPGIMAFLARGKAHGYQIVRHLGEMRLFAGREPDPPGVYRALQEMAAEGLVTAAWQTAETGPAKRVFALTRDGRACLKRWQSTLRDYRDALDELLGLLRHR